MLWAPQNRLPLDQLSDDLVRGIRDALGGQLSHPEPSPVEEHIRQEYERWFSPKTGKPRGGKDAPRSVSLRGDLEAAEKDLADATEQHRRYLEAARRVEDLAARHEQARRFAERIRDEAAEQRRKLERYRELRARERELSERARRLEQEHRELHERIEQIRHARKERDAVRTDLAKLEREQPERELELERWTKKAQVAKAALEDARAGRDRVERVARESEAADDLAEESRALEGLERCVKEVRRLQGQLEKRRRERASLAAPKPDELRRIQHAIRDLGQVQAEIDAAMICLEIVPERSGSLTVLAGEPGGRHALAAGRATRVRGAREVAVQIPGVGRIRASGPAESLEELQKKRDRIRRRLTRLTTPFGTDNPDEFGRRREHAAELDKVIADLEARLDTHLEGETPESLHESCTRRRAAVEAILREHPKWRREPPDPEALRKRAKRLREDLHSRLAKLERAWEGAEGARAAADRAKAEARARSEQLKRRLEDWEGRITRLEDDGLSDAESQGGHPPHRDIG